MKKSIALFDFDKTIYKDPSIFAITRYLAEKGFLDTSVEIEMMEEFGKYKLGVSDYMTAGQRVLEIHSRAMEGLDYSVIRDETIEFLESNMDRFYSYFQRILPKLKETHDVFLVTASPQMIGEAMEKIFGLDGYLSTEYEVVSGRFTGEIKNSLIRGKRAVKDIVKKYSGTTLAFGDSESDIGMLSEVVVPVCINPNSVLLEYAESKGWLVVNDNNIEEKVGEVLRW